jgi:putative phage-type endonuclease
MLTETQLQERRLGIGGSDIAALFNVSPFATPLDIYQSKVGEVEQITSEAIERGNRDEDSILNWYGDKRGMIIKKPMYTFVHPEHTFLRANLDGLSLDNKLIVEAKSLSMIKRCEWGKPGTNQVPTHYLLQVAHYCLVCDIDEAHLVVKWNFSDIENEKWVQTPYSIYVYNRDAEVEKAIIKKASRFWNKHVLAGVPPPVQSLPDCSTQWPRSIEGTTIEANGDILSRVEELRALKAEETQLKEKKEILEKHIKTYMRDNEKLMFNDKVLVSWSNVNRNDLDKKELKKDHPDLYQRYINPSTTRTFTVRSEK